MQAVYCAPWGADKIFHFDFIRNFKTTIYLEELITDICIFDIIKKILDSYQKITLIYECVLFKLGSMEPNNYRNHIGK